MRYWRQGLFIFPRVPLNKPSFPRKRESRTLGESVKSAGCTENEKALYWRGWAYRVTFDDKSNSIMI